MKIKTSELTGPALDWAVAKCEGGTTNPLAFIGENRSRISESWATCGPIIEREKLSVVIQRVDAWHASCPRYVNHGYGPTPLVAAMRCFVASKLGADVNIPEEL